VDPILSSVARVLAKVREQIESKAEARATALEARINRLETELDSERNVRAAVERAMTKLNERDSQLDLVSRQLEDLAERLAPPPARTVRVASRKPN
jgi:hypothetical protein